MPEFAPRVGACHGVPPLYVLLDFTPLREYHACLCSPLSPPSGLCSGGTGPSCLKTKVSGAHRVVLQTEALPERRQSKFIICFDKGVLA